MSIRRASSVTFVSRVVMFDVTVSCRQFVVSSSSCLPSVACRKRVVRSCQDPRCDALFQRPYVSTLIRTSFRSVSIRSSRRVRIDTRQVLGGNADVSLLPVFLRANFAWIGTYFACVRVVASKMLFRNVVFCVSFSRSPHGSVRRSSSGSRWWRLVVSSERSSLHAGGRVSPRVKRP